MKIALLLALFLLAAPVFLHACSQPTIYTNWVVPDGKPYQEYRRDGYERERDTRMAFAGAQLSPRQTHYRNCA